MLHGQHSTALLSGHWQGCSHSMTGQRYADVGAGGPDEDLLGAQSQSSAYFSNGFRT